MAVFTGVRITRTGIIFVAGIIVLAGLVGTGVWIAHNRGDQARHDAAVKIAQQNLESQSQPAVSTTTSTSSSSDTNNTPAQPDTTAQTATATTTTAALPTTGANPMQIIVLSVLTLAAAYYVTSRRAARDL